MDREQHEQITQQHINAALASMFPYGEGRANRTRVEHHLRQIATYAFEDGRAYGLSGLMTAQDVADHYQISRRRANALIRNRHRRFRVGIKVGNQWLIHRDQLAELEPDARYRSSD